MGRLRFSCALGELDFDYLPFSLISYYKIESHLGAMDICR